MAAGTVLYLGGVHKLLPVSFSDCRVLQLIDGSQGGQQVLDGWLQTHVDVPDAHLLVQHFHLLKKTNRWWLILVEIQYSQFTRNPRDRKSWWNLVLWRIVWAPCPLALRWSPSMESWSNLLYSPGTHTKNKLSIWPAIKKPTYLQKKEKN